MPPAKNPAAARLQPGPELEVFSAAAWQTIRAPITIGLPPETQLAVDTEGRLLMARGSSMWESTALTRP